MDSARPQSRQDAHPSIDANAKTSSHSFTSSRLFPLLWHKINRMNRLIPCKFEQHRQSNSQQGDQIDTSTLKKFHQRKWMHPSMNVLRRMTGLKACHRNNNVTPTGEGSGTTSFDTVMESDGSNLPSPCCNCLHKKKQPNDEQQIQNGNEQCAVAITAPQDAVATSAFQNNDAAACFISCRTLGCGWFSTETGMVVLTNTGINDAEAQKESSQLAPFSNPFLIKVDDYSKKDGIIISAEQMLRCMQLKEADGITHNVAGKLLDDHDSNSYYTNKDKLIFLESGGAFYSFTCRTWMTDYEREMVKAIANMSSFEDETRDNFVPAFDIDDPDDVSKYTYVLQKAAYILPGVQLDDISPKVMSSNHYHECCQPVNGTKIWDHWEDDVFRFTRPIIPHVYRMTVQFKVSQVPRNDLKGLSSVMGVRVDKAILMERTKRSVPPKVDGTAKAKSILCYTVIPGGLLVTHSTVILNTAIPTVVARVIDNFGRSGLAETCETAERTRLFFFNMRS